MLLCVRSIVCYETLWNEDGGSSTATASAVGVSGKQSLSVTIHNKQPQKPPAQPHRPPTRPTEGQYIIHLVHAS